MPDQALGGHPPAFTSAIVAGGRTGGVAAFIRQDWRGAMLADENLLDPPEDLVRRG